MCLEQRPHSIAKLGDALRLLSSRADDDAFPDMLVIERRLALAQLLDTLGIEAAAPEQRRAFEIGAAECFSPFVFRQPAFVDANVEAAPGGRAFPIVELFEHRKRVVEGKSGSLRVNLGG